MSVALHLYQQLRDAPDEESRARIIAEAFEQLEARYPHLKDLATQGHVRETELRLQKEIEGVRLEIREVEGKLRKEIEGVRLEIREVELRLSKEIRAVEVRIGETRADLIRWVVGVGLLQGSLITGVLLKVAHLI